MADEPVPPPAAAPEVLAGLELANRRFELLERRIASWERRLAVIESTLADDEDTPKTHPSDIHRFDDLEARVSRLERKRFEMLAQRGSGGASTAAASGPGSMTPVLTDPTDARALVHARWTPGEVDAGEKVTLSATVDGFPADEPVQFVIAEVDAPGADPIGLSAVAGEGDRVEVSWTPPKPKGRKTVREFTFVVRCGDREARAPVLTVRKA